MLIIMILWLALVLAGCIWLYLLLGHGQFWRADQRLDSTHPTPHTLQPRDGRYPTVTALVPARNEADVIATSIQSIQAQNYPGRLSIVVTDDASVDGTGDALRRLPAGPRSIDVVPGTGPETGWSGKLFALEQARRTAVSKHGQTDYWWLVDADIAHDSEALTRLVAHAQGEGRDLVSTMVRLRDEGFWPGLMIPAFVFFFQMLYPFRWVNRPEHPMAGAAGGCVLLRAEMMERVGGFARYRDALIDDCTLARRVQEAGGSLWLGLSQSQHSVRPYRGLGEIWRMVRRTAFTQLDYSLLQLIGSCLGMVLVFMVAPLAAITGLVTAQWPLMVAGLIVWGLIAVAYMPMLHWFGRARLAAFLLPVVAFFYTAMTVDSARRHWLGRGGTWKGRHQAG